MYPLPPLLILHMSIIMAYKSIKYLKNARNAISNLKSTILNFAMIVIHQLLNVQVFQGSFD